MFAKLIRLCLLIGCSIGFGSACSTLSAPVESAAHSVLPQTLATAQPELNGQQWWYARFQITWPEDAEPDWAIHELLAERVIKPVLLTQRQNIGLWRFHRRAGRDKAGHLFSFIFYSDRATAKAIYTQIAADTTVRELMDSGRVSALLQDDLDANQRPDIDDTSDRSWTLPMQKAWPGFIMGVSAAWLELIYQFGGNEIGPEMKLSQLIEAYQTIHNNITASWQHEGRHAFLHHLNALFAYQPMAIRF